MADIRNIILKKILGDLTPEEESALRQWVGDDERRKRFLNIVCDPEMISHEMDIDRRINWQRPMTDMARMRRQQPGHRKKYYWVCAAAACLALIIAPITYFNLKIGPLDSPQMTEMKIEKIDDIHHGHVHALLTTVDGKQVVLSDTDAVQVKIDQAMQNSESQAEPINAIARLSLDVPRGGEFKIVLEDSTVVWLNSDSRLFYPKTFEKDSRTVEVEGEAFFEVMKDEDRPFYVTTGLQTVRVYGTAFNVRGYADEDAVLITLESGCISVFRKGMPDSELIMTPGHQSRFDNANSEVSVKAIDTKIVTSWRYGNFVFEDTDLESIMRDLSRWYDFEYEFESDNLKRIMFMGTVSRQSDFPTIISILEATGEVKFTVRDNKLHILRNSK